MLNFGRFESRWFCDTKWAKTASIAVQRGPFCDDRNAHSSPSTYHLAQFERSLGSDGYDRLEWGMVVWQKPWRRVMCFGRAALFVASLSITLPAWAQTTPYPLERYRVTLMGGGLGIDVDETVIVSIVINDDSPERWIAERLRRDHNWCGKQIDGKCSATDTTVHDWIDGHVCPALMTAFADLAHLKLAGFAPPARSGALMVSDTPLLTVTGTPDHMAGYGARLSLAGLTGPVVDWWSRSSRILGQCWTTTSLTSKGMRLEAQLPRK